MACFKQLLAAQLQLLNRLGRGCSFSIVALPGRSNHQSGLALDIDDYLGWKPYLERHGWRWFGPKDELHFDFVGGGTKDIRGTAMLAPTLTNNWLELFANELTKP